MSRKAAPPPFEPYSVQHPDRTEHTQLGLAIGAFRDSYFGKPTSADEAADRSESNDQIAHLAADTIAALPHIKFLGAGFARAVLLWDQNATGVPQQCLGAGLNFVGGAGMNLIMRSSQYGFIQQEAAKSYGFGFKAEGFNHLITGMALGGLRSATDTRMLQEGLAPTDIMKSAFTTGIANIPAGFIGNRTMGLVGTNSSALSRIFTGTVSGAFSGGTFGATDGLVRGGDFAEVKTGFLTGFATGALTGGATAGAERLRQDALYAGYQQFREKPWVQGTTGALLKLDGSHPEVQATLNRVGSSLDFPVESRSFTELNRLLPYPSSGNFKQATMNPFGPQNFWNRGQYDFNVVHPTVESLVYRFGDTKIVVPKDYAAQLQEVRSLRIAQEAGDSNAARELRRNPLSDRILPEEVIPLLQRLPDASKVTEVRLFGHDYPWNKYQDEFENWSRVRKAEGSNFVAAADAWSRIGRIQFYKGRSPSAEPNGRRSVEEIMDHEQVHLNHSDKWSLARNFDKEIEATRYGYYNGHESEAELEAIGFWGATPKFLEAASEAPIRMSMLANKLTGTIAKSDNNGGTGVETLRSRIDFVTENVLPKANDILLQKMGVAEADQNLYEMRRIAFTMKAINPAPQAEIAVWINKLLKPNE